MPDATNPTTTDKNDLPKENGGFSIEFNCVSRYRWNVLDLLNLGKKALTAHVFCDIDMSRVEAARARLRAESHRVTVTPFLLKAMAIAQETQTESRTTYFPVSRLVTYYHIVAGITIERKINGEPVVFFGEIAEPNKKTILELSQELKDYATADIMQVPKLRQQKAFAEMPWLARQLVIFLATWFPAVRMKCQSATFGLSSLGAFGITMAAGPAVCTSLFAPGAVADRVVVLDDQFVVRPALTLCLCYDQRVMDDAQAAALVNRVQELLEGELPDLQSE
jgi:pyruvate/2-oxoglutarate dehydrogenase complex dihydrolipoamide acyltransferase (E2) component